MWGKKPDIEGSSQEWAKPKKAMTVKDDKTKKNYFLIVLKIWKKNVVPGKILL